MSIAGRLQEMLQIWMEHPRIMRLRTVGETGMTSIFAYFHVLCSRLHQRERLVLDFGGFLPSAPVPLSLKADTVRHVCVCVQLCTDAQACRACISLRSSCTPPYNDTQARSKSLCLGEKRMRSAPFSDAAKSQLFPVCLCFVSLSTQYFSLITLARLM